MKCTIHWVYLNQNAAKLSHSCLKMNSSICFHCSTMSALRCSETLLLSCSMSSNRWSREAPSNRVLPTASAKPRTLVKKVYPLTKNFAISTMGWWKKSRSRELCPSRVWRKEWKNSKDSMNKNIRLILKRKSKSLSNSRSARLDLKRPKNTGKRFTLWRMRWRRCIVKKSTSWKQRSKRLLWESKTKKGKLMRWLLSIGKRCSRMKRFWDTVRQKSRKLWKWSFCSSNRRLIRAKIFSMNMRQNWRRSQTSKWSLKRTWQKKWASLRLTIKDNSKIRISNFIAECST